MPVGKGRNVDPGEQAHPGWPPKSYQEDGNSGRAIDHENAPRQAFAAARLSQPGDKTLPRRNLKHKHVSPGTLLVDQMFIIRR